MRNDDLLQYADCLMFAAMRKCEYQSEAEDLVQETMLAALMYLKKGGNINYPKTWLMNTLKHKFYDRLRRKYKKPYISCEQHLSDLAYEEAGFEKILNSEEVEALRRELAYISKTYRKVLVRYYIDGDSIDTIAKSLDIPAGTVKSRLDTGRKHLKKGMETMENHNKRSYAPDVLHVTNSGRCGMDSEPGSVVEEDKIAQNLLILAYDEPKTELELAREIGIPAPYIEPIIDKLVRNELMKRCGNGKVYTDFIIYKLEDKLRFLDAQKDFAHDNFDLFWIPISAALENIRKSEYYGTINYRQQKKLEYFTVMTILDQAFGYAGKKLFEQFYMDFPDRPNGGKWIAFGYIYPDGYKVSEAPFWKYSYAGQRNSGLDNYLKSKLIELKEFDTYIDGFDRYWNLKYPMFCDDLVKLLYIIHSGIDPNETGFNLMMLENIPHFAECGILTNDDGKIKVDIPVMTLEEFYSQNAFVQEAVKTIGNNIEEPFACHLRQTKLEIPKHLKSVPEQKQYQCGYINIVMAIVYETIERKVFMQDTDFVCPPVILIVDK